MACGKNRKNFTVLKVTQLEKLNYGLNIKQKLTVGAIYNATLVAIRPATSGSAIRVQNPETLQDLVYTFDPQEQRQQRAGGAPWEQQQSTRGYSQEQEGGNGRWVRSNMGSYEQQQDAPYMQSSWTQGQQAGVRSGEYINIVLTVFW